MLFQQIKIQILMKLCFFVLEKGNKKTELDVRRSEGKTQLSAALLTGDIDRALAIEKR